MRANGYVVSVEPGSGEWLITFATQKKGENYSDYIMVLSDAEVTRLRARTPPCTARVLALIRSLAIMTKPSSIPRFLWPFLTR